MAEREDNSAPADGRRHRWVGYVWTIVLESLLTLGLVALFPYFPLGEYPISYVLLIMLIAYLFGEGPAILAFILGTLAFDYFFVPPLRSLWPIAGTPSDWAGYVAFLMGTSVVGFATVLIRRSRQQIERLLADVRHELDERKRAEKWLAESEERLRLALNAARMIAWEYDPTTKKVTITENAPEVLALPSGRVHETSDQGYAIIHPEDVENHRALVNEAIEHAGSYISVYRQVADGEVYWLEERGLAVADESGKTVRLVGVTQNITDLKHAEEALKESEERLRLAIEAAGLGTWDLDLTTDVAARSLRHDQIWGYTEPQPEWGLEIAMRNVVPEDRPRIMEAYERGIKTGVLSHENRIVWPDGTIHWISAYGRFRYDSDGRPVRVIGIVADITERKLAEERERQREREQLEFYRRTILAATGGKLIITDRPEIERIAGPAIASWEIRTPDDIRVIREAIERAASDVGFDQSRCERLGIAAGEAITNVLKHAGTGEASVHRIEDGLIVVITDHGPGIPALALPDVALTRGYSTAGTLGVGYKVMIEFTNRVYLATGDEGTTVALEMKRHAPETSPAFGLKPVESEGGATS